MFWQITWPDTRLSEGMETMMKKPCIVVEICLIMGSQTKFVKTRALISEREEPTAVGLKNGISKYGGDAHAGEGQDKEWSRQRCLR
jgi:hypothetical protein